MNIIKDTVEIGTKKAKLKENGVDDVKMKSVQTNTKNDITIKSDVNF